jgi:hypothetical protein
MSRRVVLWSAFTEDSSALGLNMGLTGYIEFPFCSIIWKACEVSANGILLTWNGI